MIMMFWSCRATADNDDDDLLAEWPQYTMMMISLYQIDRDINDDGFLKGHSR